MANALKKNRKDNGNADAAGQILMQREIAQVLSEARKLLKRVEKIAAVFGSAEIQHNGDHPIPERGRVRVVDAIGDAPELLGKEGVALAGAPESNGAWSYTVLIDNLNETYVLPKSVLKFLGWTVPSQDMYGEPAFSVAVDRNGSGSIVRRFRKRPRKHLGKPLGKRGK